MLSIPSSRHLTPMVVCATLLLIFIRLLSTPWFRHYINLDDLLFSNLPIGVPVEPPSVQVIDHNDFSDVFALNKNPLPNHNVARLFRCSLKPNNITNAVRLSIPIRSISLTPPGVAHDSTQQYFNPTVIPLPPYSPYPYLLLSRLVTEGLHQESHICLATLCTPQNKIQQHQARADSRHCDTSDIDVLGPQGGIRCATAPDNLNIPPTPAYRCEGAWAAFPDIPGFHDPRVFWSGKDEPLVIVNSASRYACVGLWIVDLRAVYAELDDLLDRRGKYTALDWKHDDDGLPDVRARMSYPHLTELMRNPRESRNAVEKNWILFFPQGAESWVQYDLVAHGGHNTRSNKSEDHMDNSLRAALDEGLRAVANKSVDDITGLGNNVTTSDLGRKFFKFNQSVLVFNEDADRNSNTSEAAAASVTDSGHVKRSTDNGRHQKRRLMPSRSLAKLIGSGYATPNLTSPDEMPCLDSDNLTDSHGRKGHWHQGSNSLRLILCSRQDGSCIGNKDESQLVEDGKIVHFAILHRKFSNDLKLPMRYERYLMVWEARYPFRIVGISQYPILFAGEKAQPWTNTENELENDPEAERWGHVYFTYTPSLAWSWRRETVRRDSTTVKVGLGTGYLGDEVIVGIGMDDIAQGFVRVKVEELLSCLRMCPGFEHAGRP